jgi:hypothetical protein
VAGVYASLLDIMISRKQPAAAAKVWRKIVELHQTIEAQSIFAYVRDLVQQREVTQAADVWRQAASISELSSYQPSSGNLVVNGDFSLPVLNGGFDWQYDKLAGVSFALDPTEGHLGVHSLLISFAGQSIGDVGLRQIVPVEPGTRYDFSACFKAPHMDGAGGARFAIQDFYSGETLYLSDELKNAEVWKQVNATFTSKPDARLLVIRVQRIPPGSPIRGSLWIDGVRLAASQSESRP